MPWVIRIWNFLHIREDRTGGTQKAGMHGTKTEAVLLLFRLAGAGAALTALAWYCSHPEYYSKDGETAFLESGRTYAMILSALGCMTLCLTPNRLSERVNRILGWIWFAAAPFAVYFSLLHLNADRFHINFFELNKIALFFTFWFLYVVLLLFVLISGSIRYSAALLAVLVAALGIANWYVINFRAMALSAADFLSIGAAATVASGYRYEVDWYVFSELFGTFLILAVSFKIRRFRAMRLPARGALLGVWLVLAGSFYHICCRTDFLDAHDIRSEGFTHQLRYKQYDMLFTTLCTCFYLAAEKPEGYSADQARQIGEPYAAAADTGSASPHLIVIMNESFADYTEIGRGLELSEDCMPFLRGLTENTIRGYAYASIFGGNTPNSEYEFLTGNTMGFLPDSSVGFNLFVRGEMPSLASELKSAGYETLAMHPYRGNNYRRHIVYPQIGFDTYYTREDFPNAQYIRNYISDMQLARRIMLEYEDHLETSDAPLFSYNVSIQNHGGYTSSNSNGVPKTIQVESPGVDKTKTNMYVNLIRKTDEMFEEMVRYYSEQDEPVAILMFGDHQANLGDKTYEYLLGKSDEELTAEERMEKYKVPFVLWTNYDIPEETIERTSLNYLYSIVADRLGLPMTGYQKYLLELSEEIPVLAAGGYWTADGSFYELGDEESPYFARVNEYNILEYNYIFGGDDRCLELFRLPGADE